MLNPLLRPMLVLLLALPFAVPAQAPAPAAVDLGPFVRKDSFENITISPNGEYLAATVPLEDRTGLLVMRRADHAVTARFTLGKDTHFIGLYWVNNTRLLASLAEAYGTQDQPSLTGELFGVDVDGKNQRMLVGYRAEINTQASRLNTANADAVFAELVDDLAAEENYVLVAVTPFVTDPYTRLERMDVRNGKRTPVTRVGARRASFITDNAGVVRMAVGSSATNALQTFHRANADADWVLVNDEDKTGRIESPIGFSADNRVVYLQVEHAQGPDSIVAWDTVSGERKEVLRHASLDPDRILYNLGTGIIPVGVQYATGPVAEAQYIEPGVGDARIYQMLEKAFAGRTASVTSTTADGKLAIVYVGGGNDPGEYYLFDLAARKADVLLTRNEWFEPEQMGQVRSVTLQSRDGLALQGVLTLPPGSDGKNVPMIINPHGGPIGIQDDFDFDSDTQLLARAGYAVLQVNFRGSSGYGRAFTQAGARQWGRAMQDDLTDATKWAIEQGIADPRRICIYGASYGAYAALMGVAREPALYRCAVGYVGVYDLDTVVEGETGDSASSRRYYREWIGERGQLADVSPNRLADRIKVPVFLAAGGEDEIAPERHTRSMEAALRTAGVPVESLYYRNESHGFYTEEHRREYFAKLLDFLARQIGGARAAAATANEEDEG